MARWTNRSSSRCRPSIRGWRPDGKSDFAPRLVSRTPRSGSTSWSAGEKSISTCRTSSPSVARPCNVKRRGPRSGTAVNAARPRLQSRAGVDPPGSDESGGRAQRRRLPLQQPRRDLHRQCRQRVRRSYPEADRGFRTHSGWAAASGLKPQAPGDSSALGESEFPSRVLGVRGREDSFRFPLPYPRAIATRAPAPASCETRGGCSAGRRF